jgi:hypothetical protein
MRRIKILLRSTIIALGLVTLWIVWSLWPEKPLHEVWVDRTWLPYHLVADGTCVWGIAGPVPITGVPDTQRWHSFRISDGEEVFSIDAEFQPNVINRSKSVIVQHPARPLQIFNVADGRLSCSIPNGRRRRIVGYGQSKYIVVSHAEQIGKYELWDVESGTKLRDVQEATGKDFSHDGELMVQRFEHEWVLVESATGRIIVRTSDKLLIDNSDTVLRRDGKALAINSYVDHQIAVVSLPELKVLNQFPNNRLIKSRSNNDWRMQFSPSGHFLQTRAGLWSLKTPGAEHVAVTDEAQATAYVAPDDESFVVQDGAQHSSRLYQIGQVNPIAGYGFGDLSSPWYAPDGQTVAMVQSVPVSTPNNVRYWISRRLNLRFPSLETLVYSAHTGRLLRRLPNVRPVGFTSDGQKIVAYEIIPDKARGGWTTTLSEWSLTSPSPPWWLWTLSAVLLGALFWPLVRKVRHYRSHAVA